MRAMIRLLLLMVIAVSGGVVAFEMADAGAGPAPTAPPSKPTGTVTVALASFGKEAMDPTQNSTPGLPYYGELYDWMVGATPAGALTTANGVLERYEPSADAGAWTFTLKKGVTWHDGMEMTADDLKFSVEAYAQRGICTQCGVLKAKLERVAIVDRYTAILHLKQPEVNIPAIFGPLEGDLLLMPKHHFEKVGWQGIEDKPLGSGAWKFVSRRIGEFIEYEANTNYWNPERLPGFARLRVLLVPEARTRVAMLKRREADLIILEPQDVAPLKQEGYKIVGPKYVGYPLLVFYKSYDPAFLSHKQEFRKALTLAVDWNEIFKAFYPAEVAERHRGGAPPFSQASVGSAPDLPPYRYDPEEARRLLQQAGYKGEKVTFWNFHLGPNPEQEEVNEVIASYLRKLGVDVDLVPIDFGAFRGKYIARPQKFEPPAEIGVQFPWTGPSLLGQFRVFLISHEAGGVLSAYWDRPKADRLYYEITAIVDPQARERRLQAINRELYEEYWAVPIAMRHMPFAAGPRIADWQPTDATPTALAFETLRPR